MFGQFSSSSKKDGGGIENSASLSPFPPCQCHRWWRRDWTIQFDRFIVAFVEPLDEFRKYPMSLSTTLPTYLADLSSVSDWTRPV